MNTSSSIRFQIQTDTNTDTIRRHIIICFRHLARKVHGALVIEQTNKKNKNKKIMQAGGFILMAQEVRYEVHGNNQAIREEAQGHD